MNPRQYLVLIKGEDRTDEILYVAREAEGTVITFKKGNSYCYTSRNVEWHSNPKPLPVENRSFLIDGKLLSDVVEALRFGNWVKIFREGGSRGCYPSSSLTVNETKTSDGRSKDVLAYFRELAEGAALKTDAGDSLIAMKYRQLDMISPRSILSRFLHARPLDTERVEPEPSSFLIFPFDCNMSQKMAVQRALQNPISLIQGPPGTGKTQTILNLIANILLQGKGVAVVSSNNCATANVLEKLKRYELDFVTAFLGSSQNKTVFIEEQKTTAIQLPTLPETKVISIRAGILRLNHELDKAFNGKNELAAVIQQLDALHLELAHFEKFQIEMEPHKSNSRIPSFQPKVSARKLLKYGLIYEKKASTSNLPHAPETKGNLSRITSFLEKILLLLRFGLEGRSLFKVSIAEQILMFQKAFYLCKIKELETRRKKLEVFLEEYSFDENLKELTRLSMQLLKHCLAGRYNNRPRNNFTLGDIRKEPEKFLNEYPVILSTTFSVITSVKKGYLFDYVIVDEASQVDMLSGILTMGCAQKLVIVGDPMQLPNVIAVNDKEQARQVALRYELPEHVRVDRHNLLSSICSAFPNIPKTLLREHYRCHPKIIDFCNQKFYGGELIIMTRDQGEPDVLKAFVTVEGKHARGTFNQRQIDEIVQNILPELKSIKQSDIGIVSPYRVQVAKMKASVDSEEIEVDTVHKYQGREKCVMIITTVSNQANEFVDNPNLLNVAVSRAQVKLRLVVSKEMTEGNGNIADFVRYIRYKNCEIVDGKIRSIFDLLYSEYTEVRLEVLRKQKRISAFDSENLAHGEIEAVLREKTYLGYGVVSQFPLSMLIRDTEHLTTEESSYACHPWTKADFLIYRKVDKSPVLVIEVDGYAFHREGTRQAERDALKDSVLLKCGLPILRLFTIGSNERNVIREKLEDVLGYKAMAKHKVS